MKNKRILLFAWVLALIPLVLVAVLYARLPAQIPTHWNLNGTVTYSGKAMAWLTAGLSPVLLLLLQVIPKLDPRKKNYERFRPYYDGFCLFLAAFLLALNGVTLSEALSPGRISVGKVVILMVGVLFLFLGNILPKFKSNFFAGIRTPWALDDPDVWNRTQRLGGILFAVTGLVMLLSGLLLPETVAFVLLMVCVAALLVVPILCSYLWYRQKQR